MASGYKNLYDLAEQMGMDLRPLAWAFMFEGERCFEGTRTFSTQGIDKPVFNLFKLYARQRSASLESTRDLDPLAFADYNGTAEGRRSTAGRLRARTAACRFCSTATTTTGTSARRLT